jgi:aspartate/glutamate racemase
VERAVTATAGLLHTVPSLAATFDTLIAEKVAEKGHELRRIHVVDGWLLATARRDGVTDAVRAAVARHVRDLVGSGADAVLVTCSSIGEAAEAAAGEVSVPVLRVDATMAEQAVALASGQQARGRIAVLATLGSTLGPTGRLVERAAAGVGRDLAISAEVVGGAAEAADAGDRPRADELVTEAVRRVAASADVVVLAQASMAAAALSAAVDVPVLTSPIGGVAALLAALAQGAGG